MINEIEMATEGTVYSTKDDCLNSIAATAKGLLSATNSLTNPQVVLLACIVASATGLTGYGIHTVHSVIKEGHPVDLEFGKNRISVNSYRASCES